MSLAKRINQAVANLQNGKLTRAQLARLNEHATQRPMAWTLLSARETALLGQLALIRPDMLPR